MNQTVNIEKLVHGGQGIGTLADGRRVFVWNALPGEKVEITLTKSKNKLAMAVAETIVLPSSERIEPIDDAYLSTSPWQMMTYEAENKYKQQILEETMVREHVNYDSKIEFHAPESSMHYRNKMEYSFWADDHGLHLALFNRGSHGKRIIKGSSIAMPAIDATANEILSVLRKHSIRGSQLKTVVVRANQKGETVAALFVKDESFPDIPELSRICKGLAVYYSTPKSPASVMTKELLVHGDITIIDVINEHDITYDVNSFFQVNLDIFAQALARIQHHIGSETYVDMYSGVGTIGLGIGGAATLVELDGNNCAMAKLNAKGSGAEVIQASAETALEYITVDKALVVDPPRAGLHAKVTTKIIETMPPTIAYLSCNPITLGRDLALLQGAYKITELISYNFFPRTPHIEALAILERK